MHDRLCIRQARLLGWGVYPKLEGRGSDDTARRGSDARPQAGGKIAHVVFSVDAYFFIHGVLIRG